jgi:hypothetical protein
LYTPEDDGIVDYVGYWTLHTDAVTSVQAVQAGGSSSMLVANISAASAAAAAAAAAPCLNRL